MAEDAPVKINEPQLREEEAADHTPGRTGHEVDEAYRGPVLVKHISPNVIGLSSNYRMTPPPVDVIGRFDPERISLKQMRQMRRDPTIALGLHAIKSMQAGINWRIECRDNAVAQFFKYALQEVWTQLVEAASNKLDFGYSPVIVRYKLEQPQWEFIDPESGEKKKVWPNDGIKAVTWEGFTALDPDGAEEKRTTDGHFDGFTHQLYQKTPNSQEALRVPYPHGLWFTHRRSENFETPYGWPLTGHAFRAWWSFWYGELMQDRHFEQDADPSLAVRHPVGQSIHPSTGDLVDNSEVASYIGTMIRNGAVVTWPSTTYTTDEGRPSAQAQWGAEFIKGGENLSAFVTRADRLDAQKLRGLLIPEDSMGGASNSTQSRDPEAYAEQLVRMQLRTISETDQVVNDHMIPVLAAENFVDCPPVKKVTLGVRAEDLKLMVDLLKIALANPQGSATIGVDVRELASQAGVPLTTPEEKPDPSEFGLPSPGDNRGGSSAGGLGDRPEGNSRTGSKVPRGQKPSTGPKGPDTGRSSDRDSTGKR